VFDELGVDETCGDDLPGDSIGEGNIGADIDAEPGVCPLCGLCAPGVDGGAVADTFGEMMEEDRVGVARVRTPQDDEVRDFDLFI